MTPSDSPARSVGIVRLQLFKPSETFISGQVRGYRRFRPFYIGRTRFGDAPSGSDVVMPKTGKIGQIRMVCLRDPSPMLKALGDRKPSLLHAHFAIDAVATLPLANRLGVPLITTLHGFDVTTRPSVFLKSGRPSLVNAVLWRGQLQRKGALFVCVSDFIRNQALAAGYPEDRTITLPIGIDLERFLPSEERTPGLIVHVARLVEKKGTVYLLRALARIAAQHPDSRLMILGDGPLREELTREATALGISDRVTFAGMRSHAESIDLIGRAACVCVPSVTAASGDSEGLPTVIFEAGAVATPVLASRTSGIPEAVIDGETGFLAPERDVEAIADRLSTLLADSELQRRFGRRARALMQDNFDMARQTAKLEDWYDTILSGKGPL